MPDTPHGSSLLAHETASAHRFDRIADLLRSGHGREARDLALDTAIDLESRADPSATSFPDDDEQGFALDVVPERGKDLAAVFERHSAILRAQVRLPAWRLRRDLEILACWLERTGELSANERTPWERSGSIEPLFVDEIVNLSSERVRSGDVRALGELSNLRAVSLAFSSAHTDDLAPLGQLARLEVLSLAQIKGSDFRFLRALPQLKGLDLSACKGLTKAAFEDVATLTQLRDLRIGGTTLHMDEDVWLDDVLRLPELRNLDVSFSKLSDRGLARICETLTKLVELDIAEGDFTAEGSRELCKLPRLKRLQFFPNVVDEAVQNELEERGCYVICDDDVDNDFPFPSR